MRCPRCELENPPEGITCDCGYNFQTRSISKPAYAGSAFNSRVTKGMRVTVFGPLMAPITLSIEDVNARIAAGTLPLHTLATTDSCALPSPVGLLPGIDVRRLLTAARWEGAAIFSRVATPSGEVTVLTKIKFLGVFSRPRTTLFPVNAGPAAGLHILWNTRNPGPLQFLHEATVYYVACLGIEGMRGPVYGFGFREPFEEMNEFVKGSV